MAWLGTWQYRYTISIDSSKIDSDLTDFPVCIKINSAAGIGAKDLTALFDEVGANSLKIAVTTSDGTTQCYVEIDLWDSGSETAVLHVKVPSLDGDADSLLYLYYEVAQADNSTYVGVVES